MPEDELVSVALVREDLRQLLVASALYLEGVRDRGLDDPELARAIDRIEATASAREWQPKDDDE